MKKHRLLVAAVFIIVVMGLIGNFVPATLLVTINARADQQHVSCDFAWLIGLADHEKQVFSQNGEDGIIEYVFQHIAPRSKTYVEFGTENGKQINTRNLRENFGWTGLLMDGSHENAEINLHKEFIFWDNIVVTAGISIIFFLISNNLIIHSFFPRSCLKSIECGKTWISSPSTLIPSTFGSGASCS
jgi:hypothetical protein